MGGSFHGSKHLANGKVLRLRPGDRVLIHIPVTCGPAELSKFRRSVVRWVGDSGAHVLIVDPGFQVEIEQPSSSIHD